MTDIKKMLTIAGSDCIGGAGIQADIKTASAYGLYSMSVVTAVAAENTAGVFGVCDMEPDFVALQMDLVFEDIVPDSVKIGMVSNGGIVETIAGRLKKYKAKNIVVDPVMVATSGGALIKDDAADAIVKHLFPLACCITPNIPEAEVLSGISISNKDDMVRAAEIISEFVGGAVLLKGGHSDDNADDLISMDGRILWVRGCRIDNPNTHGTGCTLSSAIACELASGNDLETSIKNAKDYITKVLGYGLDLGRGRGPLWHFG